MIDYIIGRVASVCEGTVVIDRQGMGFTLLCPSSTAAACRVAEEVKLLTYLQVREDGITLYGFADAGQREMFLLLTGVSGIGCKLACSILSGISSIDLASAIAAGDSKALSALKGVGKKTAERIIVELREKVVAVADAEHPAASGKDVQDAVLALVALGFTQNEAVQTVMSVSNVTELGLNEIVSAALKGMK